MEQFHYELFILLIVQLYLGYTKEKIQRSYLCLLSISFYPRTFVRANNNSVEYKYSKMPRLSGPRPFPKHTSELWIGVTLPLFLFNLQLNVPSRIFLIKLSLRIEPVEQPRRQVDNLKEAIANSTGVLCSLLSPSVSLDFFFLLATFLRGFHPMGCWYFRRNMRGNGSL